MLNFFKKPKTPNQPKPKWFVYGLAVFIFLIVINITRGAQEEGFENLEIGEFKEAIPDLQQYEELLPGTSTPKTIEIEKGSGALLICGQEVFLNVKTRIDEKSEIKEQKFNFLTGSQKHLHLTQMIAGMKIGAIREIKLGKTISAENIFPDSEIKEEVGQMQITLLDAKPQLPDIFDEKLATIELVESVQGSGFMARCGDVVDVYVKLFGSDGKVKFDGNAKIKIGASQVMLGLEQGIIGMQINGARTIVIPPAWQQKFAKTPVQSADNLLSLAAPLNGIAIAKVKLLKTEEKQ